MANNNLHSLWEQRLADQKDSGKTIRDWCRENSIKENRFYSWRRKLQTEGAEPKENLQWLPLEIEKAKPSPAITINMGQAKIEIPKEFDHNHLREIIKVLQTI